MILKRLHPIKRSSLINQKTWVSDDLLQCECHDGVCFSPLHVLRKTWELSPKLMQEGWLHT